MARQVRSDDREVLRQCGHHVTPRGRTAGHPVHEQQRRTGSTRTERHIVTVNRSASKLEALHQTTVPSSRLRATNEIDDHHDQQDDDDRANTDGHKEPTLRDRDRGAASSTAAAGPALVRRLASFSQNVQLVN